ncbi:hypothetical protein GCM10009548_43270 [Streptomyces malaysiensis subsp. malaysiensis]
MPRIVSGPLGGAPDGTRAGREPGRTPFGPEWPVKSESPWSESRRAGTVERVTLAYANGQKRSISAKFWLLHRSVPGLPNTRYEWSGRGEG